MGVLTRRLLDGRSSSKKKKNLPTGDPGDEDTDTSQGVRKLGQLINKISRPWLGTAEKERSAASDALLEDSLGDVVFWGLVRGEKGSWGWQQCERKAASYRLDSLNIPDRL